MDEEAGKKEEEKLEFTPEGEALGYISLDQARVLALKHARDNRELHGRYADQELTWEVIGTQETEDYYEVRLSYLPLQGFTGKPGVELLTIDKIGGIEFRQIVSPPRPRRVTATALLLLISVVTVVVVIVVLLTSGIFSPGVTGQAVGSPVSSPRGSVNVPIVTDQTTILTSPEGDVIVSVPPGSLDSPADLSYTTLSISEVPPLPEDIIETSKVFDLAVSRDGTGRADNFSFRVPVTVTVGLNISTIELADTNGSRIIIQHYKISEGWQELPTTVDLSELKATAPVSSLSPFALTVIKAEPVPATNAAPLASDDAATVVKGRAVLVDVMANDSDADADTINISGVTQGSYGTVEITSVGITYTHDGSDIGLDRFTYTVTDSRGSMDTASVIITVILSSADSLRTPVPTPAPTFVPAPAPTPVPTPAPTPVLPSTATPVPVPTSIPVPQFLLETVVTPQGMGSVSLNPASTDGRYSSGVMVRLVSTCFIGFDGWTGELPGDVNASSRVIFVPMDQPRSITANCAAEAPKASSYTLKVNGQTPRRGQNMLSVTNGSLQFATPPGEGGKFPAGASVSLMASPNEFHFQVDWSGVDSVNGKFATVNMDRNREVVLSIVHPVFNLTASPNPQGAGSVVGGGRYISGTLVTLQATANLGWEFAGWAEACSGSDGCVVVMDSNKSVTANFRATTAMATPAPTATAPTPIPTATPTPVATPTPAPTPTPSPTPMPTPLPGSTAVPTPTPTPTPTPSPTPTPAPISPGFDWGDTVPTYWVYESDADEYGVGETDAFDIALTTQPASNVVILVTSSEPGKVYPDPSTENYTLTFTPSNWDSHQTVTLHGFDNYIEDGDQTADITVSVVDSESDDAYHSVPDWVKTWTSYQRNDWHLDQFDHCYPCSVTEAGSALEYELFLRHQPESDQVLSIVSADTGEVTVSPASLTFTSSNWSTPQSFTVTGVDDDVVDGDQVTEIKISGATPPPSAWRDEDEVEPVTTIDND